MATWTVKFQTDDINRALEIVEDQQKKGYKAWIEDQSGRNVDVEPLKEHKVERAKRPAHDATMAILIWGTAAVVGIGGLYALGLWIDR